MARPVKSQWDFGELFPDVVAPAPVSSPLPAPPAAAVDEAGKTMTPHPTVSPSEGEREKKEKKTPGVPPPVPARTLLTVGQLTIQIRQLLEREVGEVWVTGEVSNLRAQASGHSYFTLKDADSQVSCVLFRNEARASRHWLEDGRKINLRGNLTVYEPRGQYQLRVTEVELQGVGALQLAFEKLKARLNAAGWFAAERKRPLPRYPQRIGLVTSPTGAAIRDVLHTVRRRNPALEIVLVPCRVQGQGAAEEIAAGIRMLNEWNAGPYQPAPHHETETPNPALSPSDGAREKRVPLDLILITRGGGSLEDLWAFNEEVVARAIFESQLPVVSAVGHEIDFTISDFVADVRAATPTAAAEIITEGPFSSGQFVAAARDHLRELVRRQMTDKGYEFSHAVQRLARLHPRRRVNELLQRLDDLRDGLRRCAEQGARNQRTAWRSLRDRLLRMRPRQVLQQRRELVERTERRLREAARRQLRDRRTVLAAAESRLRLLGPEQVLARGYSVTLAAETGQVIRAAEEVKPGAELRTVLKAGEIRSRVSE